MEEKNKVEREALNSDAGKEKELPTIEENSPLPAPIETDMSDVSVRLFYYLVLLFILYGFLSFTLPGLLSELWDNPVGTLGILTFGFVMLNGVMKFNGSLSRSSFVEIDRKARGESPPATINVSAATLNTLKKIIYARGSIPSNKIIEEKAVFSSNLQKVEEIKSFGYKRPLDTAFELYVCNVVDGLDKHISLTEEKGSNLLDRGLLFLFGGIVFYVAAIAAWQVWAKYGEPKETIMYIGMFASSVVFLVCEFLAAWFLKQYRHYVDASLACLRVKSVYDRYLLSYYAIKESGSEAGGVSEKLNRMLETIKEDVMWPGHKENLSNDFNYMLESMTSVHASLDKFKGLFEASAKSGKSKP
jgi:hypothetical protein